jgi:hypothetical protein
MRVGVAQTAMAERRERYAGVEAAMRRWNAAALATAMDAWRAHAVRLTTQRRGAVTFLNALRTRELRGWMNAWAQHAHHAGE